MIRIKLRQLIDDKAFAERRRITLNEVADAAGISRPTLTRVANVAGYNTNTDTINALCAYLKCTPCDLLEYVPDEPEGLKGGGQKGG
ncbi:MAG: helix-turn-helix domain-containing protein [Sinimarinibacterium flocculans]|uniref:helix-turn-helix domain-containing protein n=1 Tax=Sinimarinibacterium flocculans TaxID=985250 RepID=UPI000E87912F|nr:XRE family transcriptional regulator [Gammaproteobacteria bacterium]